MFAWSQHATHMGHLKFGGAAWDVYVETQADATDKRIHKGRLHFVAGERHRESAWIFLEWSDQDIRARFNDFSPVELWSLLESLGP